MRESLDLVITTMHLHQHPRALMNGTLIIMSLCAVMGAAFAKPRHCTRHVISDPKRTTELNQFAPRNYDLATKCQGVEHQKNSRCIIINNCGILSPGQGTNTLSD